MANKPNIKYKVLLQLTPEVISKIKSVFVFSTSDVIFITNDDKVYGFGDNANGILGLGHSSPVKEPQILSQLCGQQMTKIDWNLSTIVIGLAKSGQLYYWGYIRSNNNAVYGGGYDPGYQYLAPKLIINLQTVVAIDISCGNEKTLVLTQSGEVYSLSHSNNSLNKQKLDFNNEKVTAISSGRQHNLALTESANVFVWGSNSYGELGLGLGDHCPPVAPPTKIDLLKGIASKISCAEYHSLVLTTCGQIYGFGRNNSGQLGVGDKMNRNEPTLIGNSVKFIDIFANSNQSMAMSSENVVYIWGDCKESIISFPKKTNLTSFQESITDYSKLFFTHEFLNYNELFFSQTQPTDRLVKVMSNAFNNSETSDLIFKVKDENELKTIYAHKWFIIASSEHFERMFANQWSENSSIEINGHSYSAYYAFIRFLYTDLIQTEDLKALVGLLDIANEYLESELKQKCSETLESLITIDNVCDLYSAAVKYLAKDLETYCFKFMCNVTNVLTDTDAYHRMDPLYLRQFTTNYLKYISSLPTTPSTMPSNLYSTIEHL